MADKAERDIEIEEFIKKLVDTGALFLPAGAVFHDLGLAGYANSPHRSVRRHVFHRTDGQSLPAWPSLGRDWSTTEILHAYIQEHAAPQGRNNNLRRKKPCDDETSSRDAK